MSGRKKNSVSGSVNPVDLQRHWEFCTLTLSGAFSGLPVQCYMGESLGGTTLSLAREAAGCQVTVGWFCTTEQ